LAVLAFFALSLVAPDAWSAPVAPAAPASPGARLAPAGSSPAATTPAPRDMLDGLMAAHPGQTGSHVLERGEEALLARAWLVDHARRSIEVQYFIWSTDNIGILASEALLRAATRGVKVRVLVDDLLVDAPDEVLLALARHPNVDIRIYNPVHRVGTPLHTRLLNLVTDFRGANQRMHDKTLIVDGAFAVTGGRNMADEYYDYDHAYNFRDRDALVIGAVVPAMRASFERFWASPLSVPVERLYDGIGLMQKHVTVDSDAVQQVYRGLATYAADRGNFEPQVRAAIASMPDRFPQVAASLSWGRVDFLSDRPGKNDGREGLGGGGLTTAALARLAQQANSEVLIQSPYLVLSDPAIELLGGLVRRGVVVRISTNSLASTDNLQAFSGYRKQREQLLAMGLRIHEYRPDPAVQTAIMQRYARLRDKAPVFALHAKTLVVDRRAVYVGTYNLDPRSENLNTEVGVVIHDAAQAARVAAAIEVDMRPENSWDAARDDPDAQAALAKRLQVRAWQWLPLRPLL
jgi:putative cardiolipin synthase